VRSVFWWDNQKKNASDSPKKDTSGNPKKDTKSREVADKAGGHGGEHSSTAAHEAVRSENAANNTKDVKPADKQTRDVRRSTDDSDNKQTENIDPLGQRNRTFELNQRATGSATPGTQSVSSLSDADAERMNRQRPSDRCYIDEAGASLRVGDPTAQPYVDPEKEAEAKTERAQRELLNLLIEKGVDEISEKSIEKALELGLKLTELAVETASRVAGIAASVVVDVFSSTRQGPTREFDEHPSPRTSPSPVHDPELFIGPRH
jgi:hypothetical protein